MITEFIEKHPKGCTFTIIGTIVGILLVVVIAHSYQKVDSGNAGILIDYAAGSAGKPAIRTVGSNQYVFIPPFSGQQLIEYPIAQQQLVLSSDPKEGEVPGNSTIPCLMSGGGTINFGLTITWSVNKAHPEILYLAKPNMPLTSTFNDDVNTTLVYGAVQGDLRNICTHYTWQDVLGDGVGPSKSDELRTNLLQALTKDFAPDGITVNQIFVKEFTPDSTIHAVLNARNDAQKSAYLKQQAQYEADAAVAKATGDAKSIEIINSQLAKSPQYIDYIIAQKWNGQLPSYLSTDGSKSTITTPLK